MNLSIRTVRYGPLNSELTCALLFVTCQRKKKWTGQRYLLLLEGWRGGGMGRGGAGWFGYVHCLLTTKIVVVVVVIGNQVPEENPTNATISDT